MPPKAWNARRERQYEHIKDSLEDQGTSKSKPEEIAARTVNKERARAGEAKASSRSPARTCPRAGVGGFARERGAPRGAPATSSTRRPSA